MCADHPAARGQVCGVVGRGSRDAGDADRGGVGGEDGVWWADLGEAGEDFEFQVEDLGDGLDDHVDVVEVVHVGGCSEARAGFVGVGLAELLLGDIFGKELVCGRVRGWSFGVVALCQTIPANARPLSSDFWLLSRTLTGTPAARAATNAIPRPYEKPFDQPLFTQEVQVVFHTICPAPITPSFLTSAAASRWPELNWRHDWRLTCLGRLRVIVLDSILGYSRLCEEVRRPINAWKMFLCQYHPLERLKMFRYVDSSQLCRARRGPIAAISDQSVSQSVLTTTPGVCNPVRRVDASPA